LDFLNCKLSLIIEFKKIFKKLMWFLPVASTLFEPTQCLFCISQIHAQLHIKEDLQSFKDWIHIDPKNKEVKLLFNFVLYEFENRFPNIFELSGIWMFTYWGLKFICFRIQFGSNLRIAWDSFLEPLDLFDSSLEAMW
jgi:hypothetical protein